MEHELHPLPPFKEFCVKFLGYEPSAYDDYFECMTYLECLVYTYSYLKNHVIGAVDAQNAVIQEMEDYMEHYFDNLDVQEEINNKLDQMASDGSLTNLISGYIDPIAEELSNEVDNFETEVSNTLENFNTRLTSVVSGTPIPVSDITEMTDTTRVYVNTTNGKWYYYDGEEWQIGGTYQGNGIANNSIDILMLDNNLQRNFLKYYTLVENPTHYTNYYCNVDSSNKVSIQSNNTQCYDKYTLTANTIYQVTGGYNYSSVVGIIVADSNDNVIFSTKPSTTSTDHIPQSLLFKANDENLYLYVSYEQSGTSNYQRLNFHQVYSLTDIYINDNFNFNANELYQFNNGYGTFNGNITGNTGSKAHVYNMQKGRRYTVSAENIYSVSGLLIKSYDMNTTIYRSSEAAVGSTAQRFTYTFTATQDGLIIISTYNDSVLYNIQVIENILQNNILAGKTISCDGDSIMQGNENSNTSYYDLIIAEMGMSGQTKNSVGGATIATGTQSSGVDRHWISSAVTNINVNSDYILINGGINDYYNKVPLGTITETFTDTIDSTTFAGGMELLCRNLLDRFTTGQKILFVFNHNINATWYTSNASVGGHDFEEYYNIQVAVLKKYGIPYLDLIHESQFNTILTTYKNNYTVGDGVHPNTTGYNKFYVDKIIAKLKEL